MRYRVALNELSAFVEKLQLFEERAETIATRVDKQIADLHATWTGEAASAHHAWHAEWSNTASQMREALTQLRIAAETAHRNYAEVIEVNMAMWP
jgi:WXG100 family type VII secretion target